MATEDSGSSGEKSTQKKSTQKKSTQKKSTTKKSGQKKSTQKRADTKSASSRRSAPRAESRPTMGAREAATSAARELLALTGKEPEGITGLERTEDGWKVNVEVVEVRRIPDTTDVLALYEITADDRGQLLGYRRIRRYARGVPGEE